MKEEGGAADELLADLSAWAILDYLVKRGSATQIELQNATGLGRVWTIHSRTKLERWGLARTEELQEGRVRRVIAFPTERGRRIHELRARVLRALEDARLEQGRQDSR